MANLELTDIAAEVSHNGRWQEITLELALGPHKGELMRCPECHGPVRAHKTAVNGMRAHMEHKIRNDGCSRGNSFNGKPARHPNAVE